ncbi:hypothetical protein [Occultella glacieicola]|uniref:hypothetical protein n=1 Tax=Occultella glacieicola TaxID=2518684 RepID=UPI001F26A93E|nr:hypothetical protein [Occultella glacieicola]
MPTSRRRHQITETAEVERAIDLALRRWPGQSRSRALLKLIDAGAATIDTDLGAKSADRRVRLERMAGTYGPLLSTEALAGLRAEWPR